MLTIPKEGVEIQEVDGVKYLVAKLDKELNCSDFISELRNGRPVVVPFAKRGHLTTLLKRESIYTRQTTSVPGMWVTFIPCQERKFKS